jgi:hypothetical protein
MKLLSFSCALLLLVLANGCKRSDNHDHDDHAHFESLPHNGTGVAIGDHGFHLEFVLDPTKSKIQAYVLDDHAEHYEYVTEQSFELIAKWDGKEEKVVFQRVPDPQNPKGSNLFEATVKELATAKEFTGEIPRIVLKGKEFKDIKFPFPKGTLHKH